MNKILVKKICVKQLFGTYTYTISQNKDSNFLILYGDNGVGKTTILFCLHHILNPEEQNGHRTMISKVPFLEFSIFLSNGDNIILKRTNYKDDQYTIFFPGKDKTLTYTWYPERSRKREEIGNYKQYCNYLMHLNFKTLFLNSNRQIYESNDDIPIRIRRTHFFEEQDDIHYLKNPEDLTLQQVIEAFHRWMHQKIITLTNEGNKSIGEHYLSIIENLTKNKANSEQSISIKDRIKNLKKNNEKFTRFDLSIELFSQKFQRTISKLNEDEWKTIEPILDSYITSLELRLNALSSLQNRLQKLEDYLSAFFQNKKVEITATKGISIKSLNKDELRPDQLSSGEKQMLYLLCQIMSTSSVSSLIIIDEPEISLNIKWQREFLSALNAIIGDDNTQVIIATHSIEMIAPYKNSVVKLISNE